MASDAGIINQLAQRLRDAETSGVAIAPIRDELADGGVAAAYAVQDANTRHHIANGRRICGRKIGLTSKAVQKQLGVDTPDFGMLYADMEVLDGDEIALSRVMQPRVEAEITLVLARDLTGEQLTLTDVMSAVAYALPSIEVVGSRIENWNIRLLDTIADNASSGLYVLGGRPVKLEEVDWRLCGMVMERRGEQISLGSGAACLGNPLHAALWLARTMVEVGAPLKAGDAIMTGALGPMAAVAPGDVVEARINGLGAVRAVFGR
jgi:2-keto-4-pentenoate hydratase